MNAALHNHLRLHSGESIEQMWTDLERLRRLGVPHSDLPETRELFADGLRLLAVAGLAERSGELWLWLPAKVSGAERKGNQERMLFNELV